MSSLENRVISTSEAARAKDLYDEHELMVFRRTDKIFLVLLSLQWIAAVGVSLIVSPFTWIGTQQRVNEHVWIAIVLGGAIVSLPLYMARYHSGKPATRHIIAFAYMLMIGMLVHLTGGRIETHFEYFGALAFLAFYRDWKVIVTATAVAGAEHLIRGIYFPLSIYGVLTASPWRTLEHIWWVVFEDIVLFIAVAQNVRAMTTIANRQAAMEHVQASIEQQVLDRTEELRIEINERKNAEERISAVAAELRRSNQELESFAAIASHDLQEPLRKVQAFGERLKKKIAVGLSPEATDDMDRIQNAAARMQRLIEDLLVFSRVTTKGQPFVTVDLNVVAREVLSDLEIRIENSEGRVEVGALPTIQGDATQMRQLLQNLIANALKFKKPDVSPVIQITCEESPHGFHTIRLVDNGIGFEEKYREKIFGVFQRLHDQKQYEGTGIGLAVCKRIVERHGGQISASSSGIGTGAVFLMTIPKLLPTEGLAAA